MKISFNKSNASDFRRLLTLATTSAVLAVTFTGCFGGDKVVETTPSTEPPLMIETQAATEPVETEATKPAAASNITVDGKTVTITGAPVEVRSAPGADGKAMGKLEVGTQTEILRQIDLDGINWALVREGWICLDTNVDLDSMVAEEAENETISVIPEDNKDDKPLEPHRPSMDDQKPSDNNTPGVATNETGVVTARALNVRSEASTDSKVVGSLAKGAKVTILEKKNGWGRTNNGWISLKFVDFSGTAGSGAATNNNTNTTTNSGTVIAKGIVTTNGLNIRSGAGTNNNAVGSYNYGDRVEFTEKTTVGDSTWGKTNKGWISLNYVYMDGTRTNEAKNGRITGDVVNVRSGPGTTYTAVGSVKAGDNVEILAQFKYGNTTWGCISNGWVSMDFVELSN